MTNAPVAFAIPAEVEAVFRAFRTCEFSTLAKDGTPITWPTLPFWEAENQRFIVTTSIGFPQKAYNVRRDGRVSLLFSEPKASGLERPPAVLVQGTRRRRMRSSPASRAMRMRCARRSSDSRAV